MRCRRRRCWKMDNGGTERVGIRSQSLPISYSRRNITAPHGAGVISDSGATFI